MRTPRIIYYIILLYNIIIYYYNIIYYIYLLISLRFRTKQVIKVMRAKDKGDKKTDSNKYK